LLDPQFLVVDNAPMNPSPELLDPAYRPKLRLTLSAEPAEGGMVLFDPIRVGQPLSLTRLGFEIVRRFDGNRTIRDVQVEIIRLAGGAIVPLEPITELAAALDDALLLDSPRFAARIGGPIRKPACVGSYDADPAKLRAQLSKLFTAPGGPGMPSERPDLARPSGRLRAALLPHIDYGRGNV